MKVSNGQLFAIAVIVGTTIAAIVHFDAGMIP